MIESQREKLRQRSSKVLSIGITADGQPRQAISVPWEHTIHAFNMRTPDIYFSAEDMADPEILQMLDQYEILGCYVFDPLEDYSFLERLPQLWDVSIRYGKNLRSLSFLRRMPNWFQLYIEDSQLADLNDLFPQVRTGGMGRSYCVGFTGCKIGDISGLAREDLYLSELIICCPRGSNEKQRWKQIRCGTFRYYEYDEN